MKFYTLAYDENPDYCAIYDTPKGMDHSHRSSSGMRTAKVHDSSIPFLMAKEVPGKMVPDLIRQVIGQFVVSKRVADILKAVVNTEVEYLPVTLLNHRKKVAASDLILINVIGWYDCLDRKKTEGKSTRDLAALDEQSSAKKKLPRREYADDDFPDYEYVRINRLALHPERTPKDANLFRLGSYITTLVFADDVVAALKKEKITGATFIPIGQPVTIF
jgi:hypothetical protein